MNITSNLTSNQNTLAKTSASETMKAITSKTVTTTEEQSVAKNRDTLTLSAQYTSNYTENDLNNAYTNFTHYDLVSMVSSNPQTISKEINVRNALGYTRDLDATTNGKLKDMQSDTSNHLSQFNWASGASNGGNLACKTTSVAMMLEFNNGLDYSFNQFKANSWANSAGVFIETDYTQNLDYSNETSYMAKIKSELSQGKSCVIHVGYEINENPSYNSTHWVTVVGVEEGVDLEDAAFENLMIVDPGRYSPTPVAMHNSDYYSSSANGTKSYIPHSDYDLCVTN